MFRIGFHMLVAFLKSNYQLGILHQAKSCFQILEQIKFYLAPRHVSKVKKKMHDKFLNNNDKDYKEKTFLFSRLSHLNNTAKGISLGSFIISSHTLICFFLRAGSARGPGGYVGSNGFNLLCLFRLILLFCVSVLL